MPQAFNPESSAAAQLGHAHPTKAESRVPYRNSATEQKKQIASNKTFECR